MSISSAASSLNIATLFLFGRYAGLDRANAERIAKFEAETKAMLTQRSGLGRSSNDLAESPAFRGSNLGR